MQVMVDAMTIGNALARACLDRLHAGVVVVDRMRRVQMINAHGSRLLGAGRELAVSNRRLTCSLASQHELLGRLIESACGQPAKGGAMRVAGGANRHGLLLSVLPIPRSHDLATLLPEPIAMVVMGDPSADSLPPGVYRMLFSLTDSEATLLAALVRGTTVAGWARLRGISVATVRSQLRSLFEKTGTDSQAHLVAIAKSIPPVS